MPIPLALLYPLIGAALGTGVQAARGKKGNDLWKGAALGAGAGLGGWGLLGASGAGAAGAGAAGGEMIPLMGVTGGLPTAAMGAETAAATGAGAGATGAGLGSGFSSLASGTAKAMAPAMAMSALSSPPDMESTNFGNVPELQPPQDPFLWVQQLLNQRRAM